MLGTFKTASQVRCTHTFYNFHSFACPVWPLLSMSRDYYISCKMKLPVLPKNMLQYKIWEAARKNWWKVKDFKTRYYWRIERRNESDTRAHF
jgi:hypothetical protein